MNCPSEIQLKLLHILEVGILNIRLNAAQKNSELCAIEANHIHNIPSLINNFSLDLLAFYLNVEVPQYLIEADNKVSVDIRDIWEVLRQSAKWNTTTQSE